MSYELRMWEQPTGRPALTSLEAAGQTMVSLVGAKPGTNPKFIVLARRMAASFPVWDRASDERPGDAVWLTDPIAQAQAWKGAVWPVSVPSDDRVRIAHFVIEQATSLGLTVFDEQLGMAFLPSGLVLPESKSALWAGLKRDLEADPGPVSKAEIRKMMATFLKGALEKHGFTAQKSKRADVEFLRPSVAGMQRVDMLVEGASPHFECKVYCEQRNEQAESIFETLFGVYPSTPGTFFFNVGAFVGKFNTGLPINSRAEIGALLSLLEDKALPVLDLARTVDGLNRVMNGPDVFALNCESKHPRSLKTLSAYLRTLGLKLSLKPLIVAWLAASPDFDALVAATREFIQPRVDIKPGDLDTLLAHLREHVKPLA